MKITYLGTTTLLFDDGSDQIMFDAHVTRPSVPRILFGKIATDESLVDEIIEKHQIDRLRAIFISHSHHDHVMDAPVFAKKCRAKIYGSKSTLNVARGGKISEEQLILFAAKEEIKVGAYKITVFPSIHSEPKWYNNDLGKEIEEPLAQPAREKDYKEGGSFDFLIEHDDKKYLIRPSFNYLKGEFDEMEIDVLFQGIAEISKATEEMKRLFFEETVERVNPRLLIPLHWDNFFCPIDRPLKGMPKFVESLGGDMFELQKYCESRDRSCCVQLPLTSIRV